MIWATGSIISKIATIIKATNTITTTNNMTILIETIDVTITLVVKTRTTRTKILWEEGWLPAQSLQETEWQGHAKWPVLCIERRHFIQKNESLSCSISPSCSCSCSCFCSSSSGRSYANHHETNDNCKPSTHSKQEYLYSSKDNDDGRIHHPNKNDTVLANFTAPKVKRSKHAPK